MVQHLRICPDLARFRGNLSIIGALAFSGSACLELGEIYSVKSNDETLHW